METMILFTVLKVHLYYVSCNGSGSWNGAASKMDEHLMLFWVSVNRRAYDRHSLLDWNILCSLT